MCQQSRCRLSSRWGHCINIAASHHDIHAGYQTGGLLTFQTDAHTFLELGVLVRLTSDHTAETD